MRSPLNSPNALSSVSILSKIFGDRMLLGAGTLTDPKQVAEVAAAGGRLVVTPHADTAIVRAAKAAGLFALPGFFNPTEAFALLQAGADGIKLFPSEVLGIPMLTALRAVLPGNTIVIPVGGIDAGKIAPWMTAGALELGLDRLFINQATVQRLWKQRPKLLLTLYAAIKLRFRSAKIRPPMVGPCQVE